MPASIKIAVLDDYQRNAESFANWSSLEPAAKTVFFTTMSLISIN